MSHLSQSPLTHNELRSALISITTALSHLRIRHALIGSSALHLHASKCSLPAPSPKNIDILIQPNKYLNSSNLSAFLCTPRFTTYSFDEKAEFTYRYTDGEKIPQVVVYREGRRDLHINLRIFEHYTWGKRREYYDLRRRENETYGMALAPGISIPIINVPWLFRSKVRDLSLLTGDSNENLSRRGKDLQDLKILTDILLLKRRPKIEFKKEEDIESFRNVVEELGKEDDAIILASVVHCPEVLGPFWDILWVKITVMLLGMLGYLLAFDHFTEV